MPLNAKQKLFVKEYLIDKNATRAAKAAGYSKKTAKQMGTENLAKPAIAKAIESGLQKHFDKAELKAQDVIDELKKLAFANVANAYRKDGSLLPIHEMPEDVQRALNSVESEESTQEIGEEVTRTNSARKIKFSDKVRSLEILAKYFKLFTDTPPLTQNINLVFDKETLKAAIKKAEDDV